MFGNLKHFFLQGEANFVLVIQKHPKLVTFKSQAYRIRCVYNTGIQQIDVGFNVSMLTTAGTIATPGPRPPAPCASATATATVSGEVHHADLDVDMKDFMAKQYMQAKDEFAVQDFTVNTFPWPRRN